MMNNESQAPLPFDGRGLRATSLEAYEHLIASGKLSRRRLEVVGALFKLGTATANEVADQVRRDRGAGMRVDPNICARLTELRNMGVVRELEPRACRVSGMRTIVWEITGEVPQGNGKKASARTLFRIAIAALERIAATGNTEAADALAQIAAASE